MKIEIKNRFTGAVIYEVEVEDIWTGRKAIELAVKSSISFSNADFSNANFSYANLIAADFSNADLNNANFDYAYLDNANLGGANLSRTRYRSTSLVGANLQGADVSYADFNCADLSNADLRNADFSYADFHWTNPKGANLDGAKLNGITSYSESHAIFAEIVKRQNVDTFSAHEWKIIRTINAHNLRLAGINRRFGIDALPILEKLESVGYGEYAEMYRWLLK